MQQKLQLSVLKHGLINVAVLRIRRALKQIKKFFELHGESRFTDITEGSSVDYSKTINRAGFKAQINDEWVYYHGCPILN